MTDIDLTQLAATRGGSQPLRGYLASPPGTGPWPAGVMIHEIFGLDDVMRGHADRLADLGYLTLAVDLFSAGGTARCLVSTMAAMIRGHGRAFADICAARDYLASSSDCNGKIGVIGFCIGGGFALLNARAGYDAAAVNSPRPLTSGRARPARRGTRQRRSNPRRQGISRRQPRLPQRRRNRPPRASPLLRITGIGPEPDSAKDAWDRIERFFATHLH
jgi:carboxymethylenebutenolidase